jgi:hypothetical protein
MSIRNGLFVDLHRTPSGGPFKSDANFLEIPTIFYQINSGRREIQLENWGHLGPTAIDEEGRIIKFQEKFSLFSSN